MVVAGEPDFGGLEPARRRGHHGDASPGRLHGMLALSRAAAAGDVLGIVSIDQPLHGRRPDDPEVEVLMAVADQAGLAVQQAQREAGGAGELAAEAVA